MVFVVNATEETDAKSSYRTIIVICVVTSIFSTVVVGARLQLRRRSHSLAADDWMSFSSLLFAVTYSSLCIIRTYGLGLPLSLRPPQNLLMYTRVNFAGRPIYQVGISFFKIALLISYLRLLRGTDRWLYRLVVWATMAFVLCSHVGSALLLLLACRPIDKSWDPRIPGSCLPVGASFTAYAVLTIVSDIVVTLLPVPVLCTLNLRPAKKIGLVGSFALGLLTTLCSVLRYTQIKRIQSGDGNSTLLVVWGAIEFHTGTVVSSLPFLAPACLRCCKEDDGSKRSGHENGLRGERQGRGTGAESDGRPPYGQGRFVCAEAAPRAEDAPQSFNSNSATVEGSDTANGTCDPTLVDLSRVDGTSVAASASHDRDRGRTDHSCQAASASPIDPFDDIFAVFDA
ncbi:hypothetical protein V2A60_008764 [Cordyceps javanica]